MYESLTRKYRHVSYSVRDITAILIAFRYADKDNRLQSTFNVKVGFVLF